MPDQPETTEQEDELAVTGRQQEEEAMRGPEHENPKLPDDEQVSDS